MSDYFVRHNQIVSDCVSCDINCTITGPEVIFLFMLHSAEHNIQIAHK